MGPVREVSMFVDQASGNNSSDSYVPQHQLEYLKKVGIELGKVIGEGSYCKVRLAIQDGQYRMAVKILSRLHPSKVFVQRFLPRELSILPKLNHPSIVKVYRIIDFHDFVYVFMELADGGDLLEYIQTKTYLSEDRARSIFSQVVSALKYLHGLGVYHRDLKCENVLLHKNGSIRITDFGFSRSNMDPGMLSKTFCGSAAYAAPEVLRGIPYEPSRNDIWSLGVILFIMVTGRMPYSDSHPGRMVKDQMSGNLKFPDPSKSKGDTQEVSSTCKGLIRRMLEPNPKFRASLEEIVNHPWMKIQDGNLPAERADGERHHLQSEK